MIPSQNPDLQAQEIAAALFRRLTLNADGQLLDDNDPSNWDEADATQPEIVSLGGVHFRITDPGAAGLAIAVGVMAEGESLVCLRAVFSPADAGGATPKMGDVVALEADEGVTVLFNVAIGYADLHDPSEFDLGPDAVRIEALDTLKPGEVLLVQVINSAEALA